MQALAQPHLPPAGRPTRAAHLTPPAHLMPALSRSLHRPRSSWAVPYLLFKSNSWPGRYPSTETDAEGGGSHRWVMPVAARAGTWARSWRHQRLPSQDCQPKPAVRVGRVQGGDVLRSGLGCAGNERAPPNCHRCRGERDSALRPPGRPHRTR